MMTMKIKELTPAELPEVYPFVHQLRPQQTADEFIKIATEMMAQGYRAICLCEGEKTLAFAGFVEQLNMYWKNHIWVHELVVDEKERGKGYGEILLSHIESLAREKNLHCVALCSGLEREAAHRFYENKMRYTKTSYVFRKDL